MSATPWGQSAFDVRFGWGPTGAAQLRGRGGVLVLVDVLSFTTSVTVAVGRGTDVYPAAWRDGRAAGLAAEVGAVLAVGRREASADHPWSLSPAALRTAPAPRRLVLPSPNGSSIAAAAGGLVVAACLRNATAVAAWLADGWVSGFAETGPGDGAVTVVAAGERWPDGSLRPCLEDLLGAGAVVSALTGARPSLRVSPEAAAARAAHDGCDSVADAVRACGSGLELSGAGFGDDVDVAVERDSTDVVPVLSGGAFRPHPDR